MMMFRIKHHLFIFSFTRIYHQNNKLAIFYKLYFKKKLDLNIAKKYYLILFLNNKLITITPTIDI